MPDIRQCFGEAPSGRPLADRLHRPVFDGLACALMAQAAIEIGILSRQLERDIDRLTAARDGKTRSSDVVRRELRLVHGDAMLASTLGLTVVKGGLA